MTTASVLSAFPVGRESDALTLVFEYMAATQAETGRPVPSDIAELPAVLRRECRSLHDLYQGTAGYYDRYRLPYPEAMTEDLIARRGLRAGAAA